MSAAIVAAGYLYASGRLRGRSKGAEQPQKRETPLPAKRSQIRIAAIPELQYLHKTPAPTRPAPRIEYRTRRWKPDN